MESNRDFPRCAYFTCIYFPQIPVQPCKKSGWTLFKYGDWFVVGSQHIQVFFFAWKYYKVNFCFRCTYLYRTFCSTERWIELKTTATPSLLSPFRPYNSHQLVLAELWILHPSSSFFVFLPSPPTFVLFLCFRIQSNSDTLLFSHWSTTPTKEPLYNSFSPFPEIKKVEQTNAECFFLLSTLQNSYEGIHLYKF